VQQPWAVKRTAGTAMCHPSLPGDVGGRGPSALPLMSQRSVDSLWALHFDGSDWGPRYSPDRPGGLVTLFKLIAMCLILPLGTVTRHLIIKEKQIFA
jgi:hypothetical protein